jgi:hypothetical protein
MGAERNSVDEITAILSSNQVADGTEMLLCCGRFPRCRETGLIYDVATGLVDIVVPPARIRPA